MRPGYVALGVICIKIIVESMIVDEIINRERREGQDKILWNIQANGA